MKKIQKWKHIYLFCKVEVAKLGIVIVHGSILLNTTAHP